jgi:hypothetical protein
MDVRPCSVTRALPPAPDGSDEELLALLLVVCSLLGLLVT